jgi:hypothetical protein
MAKEIIQGFWGVLYLISALGFAATPDFGSDGLKDLDIQQTKQLTNGGIVFTINNLTTQTHSGLIEAAVIFDQPPEQTWNLLYRIEDQVKYLKELEEAKIIARSPLHDTIEFKVRFAFLTFIYRANLTFDKAGLNFFGTWTQVSTMILSNCTASGVSIRMAKTKHWHATAAQFP